MRWVLPLFIAASVCVSTPNAAHAVIDVPPIPVQKPALESPILSVAIPAMKPLQKANIQNLLESLIPSKAQVKPETKPAEQIMQEVIAADSVDEQSVQTAALEEAVDVPVPKVKPLVDSHEIKLSVADSSEALLNFGVPSAPKSKPVKYGPMAESDIAAYKRIFKYQHEGNMRRANAEFAKLGDFRLRGHVLYQRYMHPTAYRSNFYELRNWLDNYADHPGADDVYKLALSRVPDGYSEGIVRPAKVSSIARVREPTVAKAQIYRTKKRRSASEQKQTQKLRAFVTYNVSRGAPTRALNYINAHESMALLDSVEQDALYTKIARGYYHARKFDKSLSVASEAAMRSGIRAPLAAWIAGLIEWKNGNYKQAAGYFEMTGRSPYISGWAQAAGSYWAARSYRRLGRMRAANTWLARAMEHPRTFYGLMATSALGKKPKFNWEIPEFNARHAAILAATPAGSRAASLREVARPDLAEAELLALNPAPDTELREAVLSYAHQAGLASLAMRLGNAMSDADGKFYDSALYPVSPWTPFGGYKVEPALLQAIMRQESRFDPLAESPSGAAGLMQLMPATASYISGKKHYRTHAGKHRLLEPENNLSIGQKYLARLLKQSNVGGDMIALLVAYNAGPGNLSKWKRDLGDQDPLLFVESIPASETRAYVERVMANYWIYRMRAGERTPTLRALAEERPASYALIDTRDKTHENYRVARGTFPFAVAESSLKPAPKPTPRSSALNR